MRKFIPVFLIVVIIASFFSTRQPAQASASIMRILSAGPNKIDPALQTTLNTLQPNEMVTVIVTLRQQADLSRVKGDVHAARQQGVIRALQATAKVTQGPLNSLLRARQSQGLVSRFKSLWVFNGISVTATGDVINELAQQPDVRLISPDDIQIVPTSFGTPEANISLIDAPTLWNMGIYGQGVVVASMDSGVDISHPDLSARWRGGSNSWYDPYGQHPTTPTDLNGHGTQTMGVMVGGDAGGTSIGVAPQARWIAVKIFDDAGSATATAIHLGFQWLLDPDGNPASNDAPQVVNNSWAFSTPGCNLEFQLDLQSLRAAGILPVFAAGNYGPSASTSVSPSNYSESFSVGVTNNLDQILFFSSRGPTDCGGTARIYPMLVAPGANIRSTGLYQTYAVDSGTSLATPHVTGAVALLISAYPNLPISIQEMALVNGAVDLGQAGPDNTFGSGRLNVLAAYQWVIDNVYPLTEKVYLPLLIFDGAQP